LRYRTRRILWACPRSVNNFFGAEFWSGKN